MTGGNKKKKKSVANPARGFATTSTVSKAKTESLRETDSVSVLESATPGSAPTPITEGDVKAFGTSVEAQRELHELSPEELETQLEASELQQFVEQHAAKVRRDSSRQVARLQTDKRVLRGHADYLSVRDWLPDELMQQILGLTMGESLVDQRQMKKMSTPNGDELLSKVWALHLCLLNLEIPSNRVNEVLGRLIANPPSSVDPGLVWGLSEALEWLSLHCDSHELHHYDYQKPTLISGDDHATADSVSPDPKDDCASDYDEGPDQPLSIETDRAEPSTEEENQPVSDIESDLEPDELLSLYLRTKARLYQANPTLDERQPKKVSHGRDPGSDPKRTAASSMVERKLLQKIQKIASDALFDQREAEAQWQGSKIKLAREAAERRQLHIAHEETQRPEANSGSDAQHDERPPNGISEEAEKLGQEILKECEVSEEVDMLGSMFSSLPGVSELGSSRGENVQAGAADVIVRDFGRITGMSPKRVLEEACKSRDNQVKLAYRLISPTTYASRHSVSVSWSKAQEVVEASYLPSVEVVSRSRGLEVKMMKEATPDLAQSEAYVATVALFAIFSGSPKEEKSHMKLPPAFRNLWDELGRIKHEHDEATDCATVKQLRALIAEYREIDDDHDEDEVIFNASSRTRIRPPSGTSSVVAQLHSHDVDTPTVSQQIKDMWTAKIAVPFYQKMLLSRMNLPMFHFKDAALRAIDCHQITILRGQTGSGKSTQVPAFILEHELSEGRNCKIYCTEPRRISAISLAQRVSEEMGERKGDLGTARSLVGYAIRLESQISINTKLVYATTGVVLRMLENPEGLRHITHLVIDEVHERSIDTDFLLIMIRSLLLQNSILKVVLMSATIDAQRFSDYLDGAPIIDVPGRTFPVKALYLEDAIEITSHTNDDAANRTIGEEDAVEQAEGEAKASSQNLIGYSKKTRTTLATYDEYRIDSSLIMKLLTKVAYDPSYQPFSKAILVFLPGIAEIRQLNDMLGSYPAFSQNWRIHPLHSSFTSDDQQAAFEIPPKGVRKIVLATNIAETGVTIPDVTCVIDTGKHKEMRFDERRQMSRLILSFIARANAKQRRGRAGRVQDGICFHLFTKHRHDELMAEQQTPEMLRLSLQDLVMRIKICKLGNIEDVLSQALDPPLSRNIRRAIDALIEVDALTPNEDLTTLGVQIAKLPLDAQLGKLILLGCIFGCLDFALTSAATMTSKSPFLNPVNAKKQAETVRFGFKRGDSDLLTYYNAYCTWRKVCTTAGMSEYQYCSKNFLSPQNLANIEDLKGQLLTALVDAGFVYLSPSERAALSRVRPGYRQRNFVELPITFCRADNDDTACTSVLAWSFFPKILRQEGKGWRNIGNSQSLGLHPTSVNKTGLASDIKSLSFYSIMQSSSRFTNAQETSPAPDLSLVLLAGDAVFHMYAGAIVIDGNRLRYKVKDWKTMIVLKTLRSRLKDVLARCFKAPGMELPGKHRVWVDLLEKMFQAPKKRS